MKDDIYILDFNNWYYLPGFVEIEKKMEGGYVVRWEPPFDQVQYFTGNRLILILDNKRKLIDYEILNKQTREEAMEQLGNLLGDI